LNQIINSNTSNTNPIVDDENIFCYIMLMYGGQNILIRLRTITDGGESTTHRHQ